MGNKVFAKRTLSNDITSERHTLQQNLDGTLHVIIIISLYSCHILKQKFQPTIFRLHFVLLILVLFSLFLFNLIVFKNDYPLCYFLKLIFKYNLCLYAILCCKCTHLFLNCKYNCCCSFNCSFDDTPDTRV